MSRICVKNLPHYVTEERLRDHFAARGEVTDAKIMRTIDGRSRQLGFVGYRSDEEAQDAVAYFNRSFIDTFRLICEIAKPIGETDNARPWSRHSRGSSAYAQSHNVSEDKDQTVAPKRELKASAGTRVGDDPQLVEFLQVMKPRSKSKLWANDTVVVNEQEKKTQKAIGDTSEKENRKNKSSLTSRLVKENDDGKGTSQASLNLYKNETDEKPAASNERHSDVRMIPNDAWIKDESVSDLDYLRRRTTVDWRDDGEDTKIDESHSQRSFPPHRLSSSLGEEDEEEDTDKEEEEEGETEKQRSSINSVDLGDKSLAQFNHPEEVSAEQQESVAETGRLFVRNLSYTTREEDLEALFNQFGQISQVHLVLDKDTKHSKGFAYVLFMLPEAAVRAMEALDKSTFQGRLLHILPAKRPPQISQNNLKSTMGVSGMNQFKQEREVQKRAAETSGSMQSWNSLFMRADTVAENVARKYGLSKSDLLNPEAEDLAVRMALGETHIIAETKKALSDEGVNVELLEDLALGKLDAIKRSSCVILVKNLPYVTTDMDLVMMFGKFGSLERVILPPTKTLALVVYLEASEARAAFKSLAYKRFKHVPLYLEWAPQNIITGKPSTDKAVVIGKDQVARAILEQQLTASGHGDLDSDSTESRSVFVKNLNFKTSESLLKNHIEKNMKEGSLRSVKIKMKQKPSGKSLSMGFGFLEFDKPETAKAVCKQLQGTVLEGHALVLQLSHAKETTQAKELQKFGQNESSTKLLIRNVAFEATKKDLQQLFSPFGQIKSLRLPKKFDGSHRGFAFLEFITKHEAENAYSALSSTHLYGRHLVIEKAKEGESLEELRVRTATQFSEEADGNLRPKKRKKSSIDSPEMRFGNMAH